MSHFLLTPPLYNEAAWPQTLLRPNFLGFSFSLCDISSLICPARLRCSSPPLLSISTSPLPTSSISLPPPFFHHLSTTTFLPPPSTTTASSAFNHTRTLLLRAKLLLPQSLPIITSTTWTIPNSGLIVPVKFLASLFVELLARSHLQPSLTVRALLGFRTLFRLIAVWPALIDLLHSDQHSHSLPLTNATLPTLPLKSGRQNTICQFSQPLRNL
ncbi:hypothetical protein M011DRAFT_117721 [Sporormia fimetaria CBS 119925]|uniref:Uncharacterized protein n=1 Tax=Sporormia fimetaria CBS 119925 TaxID=1340428 RepID=A0A6A6VLQ7_9PLEO|nr:hypothetical protein M011DRAFT_117721 [Sporormia fimetaria CBS 119925]